MTRVNETYATLVDLELDHNNIRKEGNIITYERKIGIPNDDTLYQERVNNLRGKLENCRITLRNTCKMAQPTQRGLNQLQYRTVNARYFISDMHENYSQYKKDKTINTMLKKLEYRDRDRMPSDRTPRRPKAKWIECQGDRRPSDRRPR